ncbi:MAG TPA: acetyl-CoA decarbonylase/synthase complex subunit delta [Candidatus Omnitrophota bacterium]|nr:acetyl-CoA decarbonylase/synthase complex subunit delta [Candidatus Omnitrophota bacterium]HRZ14981.1 acetyl-CoA decarbonylase/synthase complex subunit delta [Candidatus Omnitrophota bacterium]
MAIEALLEKWQGKINSVTIGATAAEGGTRTHTVTVGGQTALPFLFKEGALPNKPVIAFEIWDCAPDDWPPELATVYRADWSHPLEWAARCVKEYKAGLLSVRLQGLHPDCGNKKPEEAAEFVRALLKKTGVPLIITGCGDDDKDNIALPLCSEAAKGQRCLFGSALQDNYKTLTAAVLADGHSLIAESPIDINIAKQLNILISDMGLSPARLVINPTIGPLGYGLEYAYSIMERCRLAALAGDTMVAMPFICFVGQESWKIKEARASIREFPQWGPEKERGIIWEAMTAAALIQAGADILVMRHPVAAQKVREYIDSLCS